mgnify:CR=1 FL=1
MRRYSEAFTADVRRQMSPLHRQSVAAMQETLIKVPTKCRLAGIELISDRISNETTIINFRDRLENRFGVIKQKFGFQKPDCVA